MRFLILGGDGMLGHQLLKRLCPQHDVTVTLREPLANYAGFGLFNTTNSFDCVDAHSVKKIAEVVTRLRPDAVINCIGIVKQRAATEDAIAHITINALLPHRLSILCREIGARLVHISTDCVFSGRKGNYSESDVSDAEDLYGRTKFLGEVNGLGCITLRTSIIGRELNRKSGLLEWALAQKGRINGFRSAIFSGFTTNELTKIIEMILTKHASACGVYQVSGDPINKYLLMQLIKKYLNSDLEIIPDDTLKIDRSLDSTRFRREFNYQPPSWEAMISDLAVS